jgi:hypothetical protein
MLMEVMKFSDSPFKDPCQMSKGFSIFKIILNWNMLI